MITQALNKPTNCGTQMFLEENKCIKAKNIPQTVHNNLSTELQPNNKLTTTNVWMKWFRLSG